jgi:enoyl-CoA hydratase
LKTHKEITMKLSVINFAIVEDVAIISLNNPPVNALTPAFLDDFECVVEKVEGAGSARSVLLASECDDFFSAGDDISTLKEINQEMIALLPRVHEVLNRFERLALPTVAAINGHALGGGLELALTCDFRFMGKACGRIGLPEVRLGMIPAFGGTQRLPLAVGKTKAMEMMFKGLQLSDGDALRIGLVNDVFERPQLYEKSFDYARRLALQATGAIGWIKKCVHEGLHNGIDKGLALEREAFKKNIVTFDAKEGVDAFLSGRKPEFKG